MPFEPKHVPKKMAPLPTAVLDGSKEKRVNDEQEELRKRYNLALDAIYELQKYIKDSGI